MNEDKQSESFEAAISDWPENLEFNYLYEVGEVRTVVVYEKVTERYFLTHDDGGSQYRVEVMDSETWCYRKFALISSGITLYTMEDLQ